MFRKELAKDSGMLFVFDKVKKVGFWMKNTYIPLSIAFIDISNRIFQIDNMWPLDEKNIHYSIKPVKYALEVNLDWFKNNNIKVGDKIKIIYSTDK